MPTNVTDEKRATTATVSLPQMKNHTSDIKKRTRFAKTPKPVSVCLPVVAIGSSYLKSMREALAST